MCILSWTDGLDKKEDGRFWKVNRRSVLSTYLPMFASRSLVVA